MTEQAPLWGLPDRPQDPLREGGSILTIRLSPELSKALQEASDEVMIDRLVVRILNEWAGISQEPTEGVVDG